MKLLHCNLMWGIGHIGRVVVGEDDGTKTVRGRDIIIKGVPWQVWPFIRIPLLFSRLLIVSITAKRASSVYISIIGDYRDVRKLIRHMDYTLWMQGNNIALLSLYWSVVYGLTVQPIKLSSFNSFGDGRSSVDLKMGQWNGARSSTSHRS